MKHKKRIACRNKVKHKTQASAYCALRALSKKGFISKVYMCRRCGFYHVGKSSWYDDPRVFWKNIENKARLQNNSF